MIMRLRAGLSLFHVREKMVSEKIAMRASVRRFEKDGDMRFLSRKSAFFGELSPLYEL